LKQRKSNVEREPMPGRNGGTLRRIPKGVSGNPKGRPKKLPELDKLLADVLGEEKDGVSAAEVILKALRAKAAKGDIRAAEVLLDRAFGKAKQSTDVTLNAIPAPIIRLAHGGPEREAD
jgi:hypothetical protein